MESRVTFKKRLKERTLDYFDWVDFRPDPNFSSLLILPVLGAVGLGLGSLSGTIIIFLGALLLTLVGALLFGLCCMAWIVANTLADVASLAAREAKLDLIIPARRPTAARFN